MFTRFHDPKIFGPFIFAYFVHLSCRCRHMANGFRAYYLLASKLNDVINHYIDVSPKLYVDCTYVPRSLVPMEKWLDLASLLGISGGLPVELFAGKMGGTINRFEKISVSRKGVPVDPLAYAFRELQLLNRSVRGALSESWMLLSPDPWMTVDNRDVNAELIAPKDKIRETLGYKG